MELHAYLHLRDVRWDDDLFTILTMIPWWSLLRALQLGLHFLTLRCHHASPSERYLLDLWVWFSYGRGWLEVTWFFRPITHLIPYWGIFPLWLRFLNLHGFAWSSPVMRYTLGWWFDFILSWFSSGAFIESFSQAHIFRYCRDSWVELLQEHRFPYHHFSGVHVRSFMHPHGVILELSG